MSLAVNYIHMYLYPISLAICAPTILTIYEQLWTLSDEQTRTLIGK